MATRRVRMKMGELRDVDVAKVSLVDRGANRVPFRIQKRDSDVEGGDDVIDFKLPSFAKREQAPVVLGALAIAKGVDPARARAAIEAAGVKVPDGAAWAQAQEGAQVLPLVTGFDVKTGTVVKLDDRFSLVLGGAASIAKGMDFADNLGAAQFLPGLTLATDTLYKTVMTALEGAPSKGEAVKAIKAASSSFGEFLGAMAERIPSDVFKVESELLKIEDAPALPVATEAAAAGAGGGAGGPAAEKAVEKAETEVKKEEAAPAAPAVEPEKAAAATEAAATEAAPAAGADAILKAVEGLSAQVTGLAKQVEGLGTKVATVESATATASALAKAAEMAAKAKTVAGAQPAQEGAPATPVRKRAATPLIDTAYRKVS